MIFLMKIMKIMILMIIPVTIYLMSKIMITEMKLKNMIIMIPLTNIGKKRKKMMNMGQEKMKILAEQLL